MRNPTGRDNPDVRSDVWIVAAGMTALGIDPDVIAQATGLSIDGIAGL